ncbi:type III secretion system chaperone [Algicola sagamiensis]|uniref:type III secretion system chaperone n=1 Tax=Algicola sagamiensis TaxID=163869 RepID=UPI00037F2D0E|nr:type III secretion system chaperone [Algicola sagamiensis]
MNETYLNLLQDLAQYTGLDAQAFSEVEELFIDDVCVSFHEQDGDLVLCAMLGQPTQEKLEPIYRVLLEANHFGIGTGGCTLGIQQETGNITLTSRHDIEPLSGEILATMLDSFIDVASFWIGFLQGEEENQTDVGFNPLLQC